MLNKFIPWDFDPSRLRKGKGPKGRLVEVRMMLPCSIRCKKCGEFMGQGKKFNSKKELVEGEDYHGIRIWRFYGKCVNCSSVFAIKTDPSRDDYTVEMGATRNFQLWRAEEDANEEAMAQKQEEEKYDAMRALENRTTDSKRQMDVLDGLDEIKAVNKRNASLDPHSALDRFYAAREAGRRKAQGVGGEEEDEAAVKLFKKRVRRLDNSQNNRARPGVLATRNVIMRRCEHDVTRTVKKARYAVRKKKKKKEEEEKMQANKKVGAAGAAGLGFGDDALATHKLIPLAAGTPSNKATTASTTRTDASASKDRGRVHGSIVRPNNA